MTEAQAVSGVPIESFRMLAALQQLTLEAGRCTHRRQLIFHMLNHTVRYCPYDRAVLFAINGRRRRYLGVSGGIEAARQSPLVDEWTRAVAALPDANQATIIEPDAHADAPSAWQALAKRTNGLSALWLPIHSRGRLVAGMWLERWNGERFAATTRAALEPLATAYGVAWAAVGRRAPRGSRHWFAHRGAWLTLAAVAIVSACLLLSVPLRIVAPCEVVPRDPLTIAAPLNGVIDEVTVLPGRSVQAGELIAIYDKRVALEELNIARQQVQVIESDLQRARVQALDEPINRAEVALLENRLQQERTRLRLAQYRVDRLEIRAPESGVVALDDPESWRGRPVQVGQQIMQIVNPDQTKLRIWLPERDNIPFDANRPLTVVLDATPQHTHAARLRFLSNHSEIRSDGTACFRAEAEWPHTPAAAKLGLRGAAVLYGEDVSLGFWLLRRPLATLRTWLGV